MAARAADNDQIATFRLNRWDPVFPFYVNRHVTFLWDSTDAENFFDRTPAFYCVMYRRAFDEFVGQGQPLRLVAQRQGVYATSSRALWRRRLSPAGIVVVERAR